MSRKRPDIVVDRKPGRRRFPADLRPFNPGKYAEKHAWEVPETLRDTKLTDAALGLCRAPIDITPEKAQALAQEAFLRYLTMRSTQWGRSLIGLMAAPNLIALTALAGVVVREKPHCSLRATDGA